MTSGEIFSIDVCQICNLSRLPIDMENNPVYKTVKEIIENNNNKLDFRDTSIYRHYNQKTSLRSLGDLWSLNALKETNITRIFLPWIHDKPVVGYTDTAYLKNPGHAAIEKKVDKLRSTILSIQKFGYRPDRFPDRIPGIVGYYLKTGANNFFYVVSGNHRAATLAALFPGRKLPVMYDRYEFMKPRDLINNRAICNLKMPRSFDIRDIPDWPSVKSGFLTATLAEKIFRTYVKQA